MIDLHKEKNREPEYRRNNNLEELLHTINSLLTSAEAKALQLYDQQQLPNFPIIFVMGPHRSGTTLLLQWLANTGIVAYPTNLLARFYGAPVLGALIQKLLTDPSYNFRDELYDLSSAISFDSQNGKTRGALSPNEFWYFWRRFLPLGVLDYVPTEMLLQKSDTKNLVAELFGMMQVFQKPMALKAMILNYNIDFLDQLFEKAIFIYTRRDPLRNIESALKARERQSGSIEKWYSFKIPEYYELLKLNPYEQVAGQIYYINKSVEAGLSKVAEHKKMIVSYEEFCENPEQFFNVLKSKLALNDYQTDAPYTLQQRFELTRKEVKDENILSAYKKFYQGVSFGSGG